jgi:hypothetical protein
MLAICTYCSQEKFLYDTITGKEPFFFINQDLLFLTGGFHEKNIENYTLYHIDHGSIASCGIRSRSF